MSKFKIKFFFIFIITIIPTCLFANAGTTLIWAHYSYFIITNIIISVVESLVYWYRKIGTRNYIETIALTVGANYISAFVGLVIFHLILYSAEIDWNPLGGGSADESKLMITFLIISFFGTIIIEGFFLAFTLFIKHSRKDIIKNVILANIISYALLVINYLYWVEWSS